MRSVFINHPFRYGECQEQISQIPAAKKPELGHHSAAFSTNPKPYICAYIHRCMASKTISIRDDVYKLLKDAKREGESFSDAIKRLLKKDKVNLSEYFGALKEDPILDRLEADSKRIREMARSRV